MSYEPQPLYKAVFTVNNLVFAILGSLLVLIAQVNIEAHAQRNTAKTLVYAICQQARQEVNGASEQACGDAQDRLGIEYLCQERNSLPTNTCWTEVK